MDNFPNEPAQLDCAYPQSSLEESLDICQCAVVGNRGDDVLDLTLNCWVRGHEIDRIFSVNIPIKETVASLKKAIKSEKPADVGEIDADTLDLYEVCLPRNDRLPQSLKELFVPGRNASLTPGAVLSDVFQEVPPPGHVHVVIESPHTPNAHTIEQQLEEEQKQRDTMTWIINYVQHQSGDRTILDCRPAEPEANPMNTIAPPIQLFHPAFAYFLSRAFDTEYVIPESVVRDTRDLMVEFALTKADKSGRQCHLKSLLSGVFNLNHSPISASSSSDKNFHPSTTPWCGFPDCLIIREGVPEHAALSLVRQFDQRKNAHLRRKCCCPAFIVSFSGPWLTVAGGVFIPDRIVQQLTDMIWIPVDLFQDDHQFLRIARILYALGESVMRLDSWYKSLKKEQSSKLPVSNPHPQFFPSPCAYRDGATLVEFTYQKRLKDHVSCATYHAKTTQDDPKDIVIKFLTSYGADVHRKMALAGYAPDLLYYGQIDVTPDLPSYGDLRMVVMDYVNGWTLEEAMKQKKVPGAFEADIRDALKQIHDGGDVYGNLQPHKVMITPEGKVKLIGFEWAGKQGEARYPVSMPSFAG